MLNMPGKWKWIPLISGALVVPFAGQTRLQAADARNGLRDYLKNRDAGLSHGCGKGPNLAFLVLKWSATAAKRSVMLTDCCDI